MPKKKTTTDHREVILSELERRGWTMYRLSQEVGAAMQWSTLSNYLNGKSDLSVSRVEAIMRALDITLRPPSK